MLTGTQEIKAAYQDDQLAAEYLASRYENDPFGRAVHERQAAIVARLISTLRPARLLEIACGPGRLTVHVPPVPFAVAVEQSPAMLQIARRRLRADQQDHWQLVRGDAFHLPVPDHHFDAVMVFKLIRHFAAPERRTLLGEIRRVLQPGGHLILDVVNAPACRWLHQKWGLGEVWIDDHWFTRSEFVQEMKAAGFRTTRLVPVQSLLRLQYQLWARVHRRLPGLATRLSRCFENVTALSPLEWIALCRCE